MPASLYFQVDVVISVAFDAVGSDFLLQEEENAANPKTIVVA